MKILIYVQNSFLLHELVADHEATDLVSHLTTCTVLEVGKKNIPRKGFFPLYPQLIFSNYPSMFSRVLLCLIIVFPPFSFVHAWTSRSDNSA